MIAAGAPFYMLLAGGADDLWEKIRKGKELELEERKDLPPWMQGHSALGTEKSLRVGTDEATGFPVYADIARMLPLGDLADVTDNGTGMLTFPAPLNPLSNPVVSLVSAMMPSINKELYTGKDIVDLTDTGSEAAEKRIKWMIKTFSPPMSITGRHGQRAINAIAHELGETIEVPFIGDYTGFGNNGLPVEAKYAIPQTFGIKISPIDLKTSKEIAESKELKPLYTLKSQLRQAGFLRDKKAISQREFDQREAAIEKKIDLIVQKN